MTTARVVPGFDELYEQHRERLYRAMVLATNDRDLSLEGVDRGFARLRRRERRSEYPEAVVLRGAAAYVAKRSGADSIRGFRLPDAAVAPAAEAVVNAVRGLQPDRRLAVIASLYLGWDDGAVAEATGITDPAQSVAGAITEMADELGLDGNDATEQVAAGLTASAGAVSRPLSRLESVKTEGRTHSVAVAAAAAAVVLVTVGGVALGVRTLRSESADEPQVVATPSTGTAADSDSGDTPVSTAAAPVAIGEVTWVQSGLPFREGDLSAATAGPDGFIAIGQDYRDPTGNGARLLISESGYDWTVLDSPIPRNGWVHNIVYDGGRYVAVGSSFDEVAGRDSPVILVSEDANVWETLTVPIEPTIEIDGISLRVYTSVNTASVQDDELIVFVTQHAEEDIFSMFAGDLPEDVAGIQNWGISPGGIDFYTNQGELIRTVPAEELGVSPDVFALMSSGRSVAWKSSDGGATWEESALGAGFGPDSHLAQLTTRGDVSVAVVYGRFGAELWSIADEEWAPVDLGRGVAATGLASFGGGFVATGADATGATVWRSDDGVVWRTVESDSFADLSIDRISATPHGLLAVGQVGQGNVVGPAIVQTDDGFTVEIDSTGRHVVTDSEGTIVLEVFGNEVQYGAEGGIVLADPESGETIVTLHQRDIDAAWELVWRELDTGAEFGGQSPTWALLVSRDGETWSRVDAEEFGQGFYPNVAVLGADRILVTGWVETGIEGGLRIWVGEFGEG